MDLLGPHSQVPCMRAMCICHLQSLSDCSINQYVLHKIAVAFYVSGTLIQLANKCRNEEQQGGCVTLGQAAQLV